MGKFRKHGKSPFTAGVIHGGPGARGEMYPVAQELSDTAGIIEPLQTAASVTAQVEELREAIETQGSPPMVLIGHSWGAWLICLLAARYPALVKKLVLVSSGPFEEKYIAGLSEIRLSRLQPTEREEMTSLFSQLNAERLDNQGFARLGKLIARTDSYRRLPEPDSHPYDRPDADMFRKVWAEASEMRRSGQLLQSVQSIRCEVVAIHGDYDSHPFEGVKEPLSRAVDNFRFILLHKCGHEPWLERYAREEFYRILRREIHD